MTHLQTDPRQKEIEQLRQEVARLHDIEAGLRREIAERKQLETTVSDTRLHFHRVFENAPIGMALVGLDEQILQVNQALCDILGYDNETLLTKTVPEITHPDDITIEAQYKDKTREAQFDNFWMEKRYIHADGQIVWGRLSISAVLDQEGQPLYFIGQLEDITERRQAEEALRNSETRFRTLVEQSSFSIIIYDKNGRIRMANPASKKLWRLSQEEFSSLIAHYNILEDETLAQTAIFDGIKRAYAGESVNIPPSVYDFQDYPYPEKRPEQLWVAAHTYPIKDKHGQIQEVVVMHEDVSNRVQAEANLHKSEAAHRTLVQTIPYGVHELTEDGRIIYVNPAFCRMIGYTEEELIGQTIQDLLVDEIEQQQMQKTIQKFSHSHSTPETYYTRVRTKDGRIIQTQTDWDYRPGANGSSNGSIAIVTDITDRQQAEERLQNYTQRLKIVHEVAQAILSVQSPEAVAHAALTRIQQTLPFVRCSVVLFDFVKEKGLILASFDQQETGIRVGTCRPLGDFDIDERLFTGEYVVRHQLDQAMPALVQRLKAEGIHSYLSFPLLAQGKLFGALYLAAGNLDAYSEQYVETIREIAEFLAIAIEQARLHEQVQTHADELEGQVAERTRALTVANEKLKEMDRLKSKFVSDVSHELRTPVTNLNLYLDLTERGNPERLPQYLTILREQTERLNLLVEGTLNLSRLDLRRDEIILIEQGLNPLVKQVATIYHGFAFEKGLSFDVILAEELPPVLANANQLSEMIGNLIDNAIKYTSSGQIKVRTFWDKTAVSVAVQVQDTGIGLDETDLDQCFEPFYRGVQVGQLNIPGNGLGLALVSEIIDVHNGRVDVQSESGAGSIFTIWLPAVLD